MDIKEIAQKLAPGYWKRDQWNIEYFDSVGFAEALIESYKEGLLKEVGEPVGYLRATTHVLAFMPFREVEDGAKFYPSDQVAAAVAKATKPMEDQLAKAEQLWQVAKGRCDGLEEKLAKAEQRVAEACALQVATETKFHWLDAARVAKEIRSGEWRKFVKEV